jgi:hypothetical protein
MEPHASAFGALTIKDDPEATFTQGWLLCDVGQPDRGFPYLRRAVANGYFPAATLAGGEAFERLRGRTEYRDLLAAAESGRRRALEAFRAGGGDRLLGV